MCNLSLVGAQLSGAKLGDAKLVNTDLTNAVMIGADLIRSNLSGATLQRTALFEATLFQTNLTNTRFDGAILGYTLFQECPTLHKAVGLANIHHFHPCTLDAPTLRANIAFLPDTFLQGVGYTQEEIQNLRAVYSQAIQFYSCFLSHTDQDAEFTDRLRSDLQAKNVTCWHYRYDIPIGSYWREEIGQAIKVYDKLVLVCSEHSLVRKGVVEEIIEALEYQDKPRHKNRKKIYPLRLDDFIFNKEMEAFAKQQVVKGEWGVNWLPKLKAIQMADFRQWKNHDAYKREFDKLLKALKAPAKR